MHLTMKNMLLSNENPVIKVKKMMVTKLKYGNTNTFFIRGENQGVLIDTDYAGTMPMFYKALKENGLKVKDISYIIATHYHPDHIGLISELMEQGVQLLLAESQKDFVHFSDEIFSREPKLRYKPIDDTAVIIIPFEKSRSFLKDIGIDGEIIQTPSHSADSISVVLDEGICIIGDLEPFEYLNAYEKNEQLQADWNRVLSYNPKVIYYAHANERFF